MGQRLEQTSDDETNPRLTMVIFFKGSSMKLQLVSAEEV